MMMSPIGETSKHKLDDDEEFFNIDLMGDDIGKILASSKNQEELCSLLGIHKTTNNNMNMNMNNMNNNGQ